MENKTIVQNYLNAADKNDFATVEKLFGPRHKFYSTMSPEPLDTKGHVAMMQSFHGGFSDTRHEIIDIFENGNKVAVRGVWHATNTGSFNGMPATGKTVHLSFISIGEIENGEIVNQWMELDSMNMMIQLGAIQAPAAN